MGLEADMFQFLQKRSDSYVRMVLRLMGHLLSTGNVFPARILEFVENFELYLIYGDSIVCALALLLTAWNFISSMVRGEK